jgi:hypothetical protein
LRTGFLVVSPLRIACVFLHVERGRSSKRVWRSPRITDCLTHELHDGRANGAQSAHETSRSRRFESKLGIVLLARACGVAVYTLYADHSRCRSLSDHASCIRHHTMLFVCFSSASCRFWCFQKEAGVHCGSIVSYRMLFPCSRPASGALVACCGSGLFRFWSCTDSPLLRL